ncbi:hypothetical protein [Streptacidiphilus neutrinimicus]|uniref:hypothetical protein n=1 Tax=Streptacidiphilus neutrinimicus TaxID=105420 RepID=UPI0034E1ED37
MSMRGRLYRYIGPTELRGLVRPGGEGCPLVTPGDFEQWVGTRSAEELADPFTFVVDADGVLRLAPRRRPFATHWPVRGSPGRAPSPTRWCSAVAKPAVS